MDRSRDTWHPTSKRKCASPREEWSPSRPRACSLPATRAQSTDCLLARSQGKHTNSKKPECSKPKRAPQGDQQKLRKGAHLVIGSKIAKKQTEQRAQEALTKKIAARIEATMASRASGDGGGLRVLKDEGGEGGSATKLLRTNTSVLAKSKR